MDAENQPMKFCKYCGGKIPEDAVLCTLCGRQVEELRRDAPAPQVIINNAMQSISQPMPNRPTVSRYSMPMPVFPS